MKLCDIICVVTVVVGVDAELDESSVDDVNQIEDRIVSQWREVSADEQHHMRGRFDDILRPYGFETKLLVIQRSNSIAVLFGCLTSSAVTDLRDLWLSGQLKDIVQSLLIVLSGTVVCVKRLNWSSSEYELSLSFFNAEPG